MNRKTIAFLSVCAIFGVMGSVSAISFNCSLTSVTPVNGSRISDPTPTLSVIPICNVTTVNITFQANLGNENQTVAATNNTRASVTLATSLTYGATYYWNVTFNNGPDVNGSGLYNFHLSRFGAAGETIDAVTNQLIDPIANLVLGLIKLFVALFVIAMVSSIFQGISVAVTKRI